MCGMRSLLCVLVVVSTFSASAQRGAATAPPEILQIYRDSVKPGKMAEYTRVEGEAANACFRANTWPYFAAQSITGPEEVWFVSGFDTYAAMEKSAEPFARNAALGAELGKITEGKANLVSEPHTIFFRYRDELGRNNGLVRPGARFFTLTWFTLIPGHEREFEESQRLIRRVRELLSTSVATSVTYIFAISPPISNPAGEWIADDPEFWKSSPPLQRQTGPRK